MFALNLSGIQMILNYIIYMEWAFIFRALDDSFLTTLTQCRHYTISIINIDNRGRDIEGG